MRGRTDEGPADRRAELLDLDRREPGGLRTDYTGCTGYSCTRFDSRADAAADNRNAADCSTAVVRGNCCTGYTDNTVERYSTG